LIKIRPVGDVQQWISAHAPGWPQKAARRADKDLNEGRYQDRGTIWSDLKLFFIEAQLKKCAYCESYLGSSGTKWEVEHYRPKASVLSWQSPQAPDFNDQPASECGYYRLAYNPANYVGACGSCNGPKWNYFPVHYRRQLTATDPQELARENPLLINPIDPDDQDPEELIEFYGPTPRPRSKEEGPSRLRALATIELLRLRDEKRIHDRCSFILGAWEVYRRRHDDAEYSLASQELVDAVRAGKIAFSSCLNSFLLLCDTRPAEAETLAEYARKVTFGIVSPAPLTQPEL
jgi:5-methylcytosine-specific restriction endonuclease McrA